jgi:rhamnose transport system permease protein
MILQEARRAFVDALGARLLVLLGTSAILALLLAWSAPEFYSWANLRGMAVDAMPKLLLAAGMTLVILAGQIDVSIGAQLAVCGVVLGLASRAGLGMPLAVLASVCAGAGLGLANGCLVARARMPAILATLAMLAVLRGVLRWGSGGAWIQGLPSSFQWYGLGQASGQLTMLLAGGALFALLALFLERTRPGRSIPATGCDAEAVRRAGVDPDRVVLALFVAMGAISGLAAALSFPRFPAVEIEAGAGLELEVIASVVLGGTAIRGGRGSFAGTLLGVVLLALLGSALVFLRVDVAWERAIQGSVLLAAVGLDALAGRRRSVGYVGIS